MDENARKGEFTPVYFGYYFYPLKPGYFKFKYEKPPKLRVA